MLSERGRQRPTNRTDRAWTEVRGGVAPATLRTVRFTGLIGKYPPPPAEARQWAHVQRG
jgi:hypothetical protein